MTTGAIFRTLLCVGLLAAVVDVAAGGEADAARGYRLLRSKPYLPADFDQQVFDQLWTVWDEAARQKAAKASPQQRREMAYQRYGLLADPDDPGGGPLQYVVDRNGNWIMNCLACHQGQVDGRIVAGLPNTQFALASLTDDVRAVKMRTQSPLARMDIGSLFMPLGTSRGTTNAVMFGVALMHYRDGDLNIYKDRGRPRMVHHDLDAPAWWHFKKKSRLYYDGFVPKSHRSLMQFLLVPENGPEKFREWEDDFRDIFAWLESLEPPPYPAAIDEALAGRGQHLFKRRCASCHGSYGEVEKYPGKVVSIDVVDTDRVRLDALTPMHRRSYAESWFGEYDKDEVRDRPEGYVAPPLDGIWASAPYLHNGSVPTLWHLLHADDRPVVWCRDGAGYDHEKVGLRVTVSDSPTGSAQTLHARREYFDTRRFGKGADGHRFPERLTETEKRAVLEYLKTL